MKTVFLILKITAISVLFCCISTYQKLANSMELKQLEFHFPDGIDYDFGLINRRIIEHQLPAINTSDSLVIIKDAKSNAGYVLPLYSKKIIPPGDTLWIGAKIDTNNKVGIRKSLVLLVYYCNGTEHRQKFRFTWENR